MNRNIISTYFYEEENPINSSYANIKKHSSERNLIYWKTVYCFYYTSVINNPKYTHVFFTNKSEFPFRANLEELGIIIFDDLELTRKNIGKWAAVKFFFDVIDFIFENDYFIDTDKIIMLDTDCISFSSAKNVFNKINMQNPILGYLNGVEKHNILFHGESLLDLNSIYKKVLNKNIIIEQKIGGEFLGFIKSSISDFRKKYQSLLDSEYSSKLTTEEQILSMINADIPFLLEHKGITRVWTTLRYNTIPKKPHEYAFLHFPSEKEIMLNALFNRIIKLKLISKLQLDNILEKTIPIKSKPKMLITRIILKIIK